MPSPRPLLASASIAVLLLTGCGGDDTASDEVRPVTGVSTTDAPAAASTTAAPDATTAPSTTPPTNTAPPSTKPPATAPPSALLDEVLAAYDAAYADLLAAEAIPDENYPPLTNHIHGGQLDAWRNVIRELREDGQTIRRSATERGWRRVEGVEQLTESRVAIEVCRYDTDEQIDHNGAVMTPGNRTYRYVETFDLIGGGWKWSGREWVDPSPDYSDCALQ